MLSDLFPSDAAQGRSVVRAPHVTWRYLWPVLGVAFLVRLFFAQWADVQLHPDETYQYYEQAYRLIHGYGLIPWEYVFGIRSWFIPLCLAGLLVVAEAIGLDQPYEYAFFVKSVLCLISLSLPLSMYRLGQVLWNEQVAVFSFLLGCFWHHFLYMAHKPMPGVLAMYGLVWLVVWMLQPVTRARAFWFGLMVGLVFTLRYQLLPVLGLVWLIALYRLRGVAVGPLLMGSTVAVGIAGVLDWYFWGGFLTSFVENFRLNFLYDIASTFSEKGGDFYIKRITKETGGLFLLGLAGFALVWRQAWAITVSLLVGFALFHVPAHKELRFVLWIVPFSLVGSAIATLWLADRHALLQRVAPIVLCVVVAGPTVWYGARYLGVVPFKDWWRDGTSVMRTLSETDDVTAVEFLTPSRAWAGLPGYYTLGKPVPLYMFGWHSDVTPAERATRLAHVSHIVAEADQQIPPGYVLHSQHGIFSLWHSKTPKTAVGLEGFNLRTPYPTPIPRGYQTLGSRTPLKIEGW